MKYKLIKRANPQNRTKATWHAVPIGEGKITTKELVKDLVSQSSLSRGEVANVLENLIEIIPQYLMAGKSVCIEDFGTFRISFSSEGVSEQDDFKDNKIKDIKVIFTSSVELKTKIDKITFEEISL